MIEIILTSRKPNKNGLTHVLVILKYFKRKEKQITALWNTLTRYKNATIHFRASFQWNRNGETGTQQPKLLSHHQSKHLIKRRLSGTFSLTLGEWKTRSVPLVTKWLNYEDNLCRMTIHEKKLFQNLQRLLGCTLTSTEKPHFCRFIERN